MREILFRGKTPITETWVYGTGLLFDGTNTWIVHNEPPTPLAFGEKHFVVIPSTVGQFTGLFDKNGKKIFEGDIVEDYYGRVGVVEYCVDGNVASCGCCYTHFVGAGFKVDKIDLTDCKVIGNIHDNP